MNRLSIVLVKRGDILVPATRNNETQLLSFTAQLTEGQQVDAYISEFIPDNHSTGQLAKVHAMIRDIAQETGSDSATVKDFIKKEAGLTKIDGAGEEILRSFAHCSKEEVSLAIQVAIKYADMLGITLPDRIDTPVPT